MRFIPALIAAIFFGLILTWIIHSVFYPDSNPLREFEEMVEKAERPTRIPSVREEVPVRKNEEQDEFEIEEEPAIEIEEADPNLVLSNSFSGPRDFIAYYPLDGHTNDMSPSRRRGHFSIGEFVSDREANKRAAYFNSNPRGGISVSKRVTFSSPGVYSFAAWIYPIKLNVHNTIMSQVSPGRDFNLKLMNDGSLQAHLARGAAYQFCTSDTTVPMDKWTHVAATADAKEWKLYIDGEHVKTCEIKFLPHGISRSFKIGSMEGGENFSGGIDDVLIYDKTLTDVEIRNLAK